MVKDMLRQCRIIAIFLFLAVFLVPLFACSKNQTAESEEPTVYQVESPPSPVTVTEEAAETNFLPALCERAGLPEELSERIIKTVSDNPSFVLELLAILQEDPALRALVDKAHPLAEGYAPDDLVALPRPGASYTVSRAGLVLRLPAEEALEQMAAAAKADGVTLMASSTYRSYDYQVTVYNRVVSELGQEAADRESARPGHSQHQTGLVVDFGSITDAFAETAAGKWMLLHAGNFGWSLSFPQGYEAVTGYRWESWHWRYVGLPLAQFINSYFDGIQQYALEFIYEWEKEDK
jgi:D-alanyl-D-alanine carboxypeptidase